MGCHLSGNTFSDDETISTEELTNLLEGDLNQPTFEQAKHSAEWPEWERAIQSELAQLCEKDLEISRKA